MQNYSSKKGSGINFFSEPTIVTWLMNLYRVTALAENQQLEEPVKINDVWFYTEKFFLG